MRQADAGFTSRNEGVEALVGLAVAGVWLAQMVDLFGLFTVGAPASSLGMILHDTTLTVLLPLALWLWVLGFGASLGARQHRDSVHSKGAIGGLIGLFILGGLNSLIFKGDVLQALAVTGLIVWLANRLPDTRLLIMAAVGSFTVGTVFGLNRAGLNDIPSVYLTGAIGEVVRFNLTEGLNLRWVQWIEHGELLRYIGLGLTGLVLGRARFFADTQGLKGKSTLAFWLAAGLLAGLCVLKMWAVTPEIVSLGLTLLMVALSLWLLRNLPDGLGPKVTALWAPVGRIGAALYLMQCLVWVPVIYGFGWGWYESVGPVQALGVGVIVLGAQTLFAHFWDMGFYFGRMD